MSMIKLSTKIKTYTSPAINPYGGQDWTIQHNLGVIPDTIEIIATSAQGEWHQPRFLVAASVGYGSSVAHPNVNQTTVHFFANQFSLNFASEVYAKVISLGCTSR